MKKSIFAGRDTELSALKEAYIEVVDKGATSTRVIGLIAEPGLGKTRIVQEFFNWVSTHYDAPGSEGYWPDELDSVGNNLLVTVSPNRCNDTAKLPFLWWGIRVPEGGNDSGISTSVLGSAVHDLRPHLEAKLRARRTQGRLKTGAKTAGDAAIDIAIETVVAVAGVGVAKTIGKAALDLFQLGQEQWEDSRPVSLQEAYEKQGTTLTTALINDLRHVLGSSNDRIPGILIIDDAQFSRTDPGITRFLAQLLEVSHDENWPLLIIVTHWEKEWWEHSRSDKVTIAKVLSKYDSAEGVVKIIQVPPNRHLDRLLSAELPGLKSEQYDQILNRADGNPRYLVEIIALAKENPQYFENRNVAASFSEEGLKELLKQSLSLHNTIKTRLAASSISVRAALSLASQQGTEFTRTLVEAVGLKLGFGEVGAGIVQAEQPHSFIRGATEPVTTFVQGIYREVAQQALPALLDPTEANNALADVVREMIRDQRAYDALTHVQRSLLHKLAIDLIGQSNIAADIKLACSAVAQEVRWMYATGDIWGAAATAKRYVELARLLSDDNLAIEDVSAVSSVLLESLEYQTSDEIFDRHIALMMRGVDTLDPTDAIELSTHLAYRGLLRRNRNSQNSDALADLDKAIDLLKSARVRSDSWPPNGDACEAMLLDHRAMARFQSSDAAGGKEDFIKAISLMESLRESAGWTSREQHILANLYSNRGMYLNDPEEAEADLSNAIKLREAVMYEDRYVEPAHMRWLSNGYIGRAKLRQQRGNLKGAEEDFLETIRLRKTLISTAGARIAPRDEIKAAEALQSLAEFYGRLGHREAELHAYKDSSDIIAKAEDKARDLQDQTFRFQLASFVTGFARSKWRAGLRDSAMQDQVATVELLMSIRESAPSGWSNEDEDTLLAAVHDLSNFQANVGQHQAALKNMAAAAQGRERLRREFRADYTPRLQRNLVRSKAGFAGRLNDVGRRLEALDQYRDCFPLMDGLSDAFFSSIGEDREQELAWLYERMAWCLHRLGRSKEAGESIDKAISLRAKLTGHSLADLEALANVFHTGAEVFDGQDYNRMLECCDQSFAAWERINESVPDSYWTINTLVDLSEVHCSRGNALFALNRDDEAAEHHQTQIQLLEQALTDADAPQLEWQNLRANGYHNLARVFKRKGDLDRAAKDYRTAVELRHKMKADAPDSWTPLKQEWLGNGYHGLSTALRETDLASAVEALDQAIAAREEHLELLQDSVPAQIILQLGDDCYDCGVDYLSSGRPKEALERFSKAINYRERAKSALGPDWKPKWESHLANAYALRSKCHLTLKDFDTARADADRAVSMRELLHQQGNESTITNLSYLLACDYFDRAHATRKNGRAKRADLNRAMELLIGFKEKSPDKWASDHARLRIVATRALAISLAAAFQFPTALRNFKRTLEFSIQDIEILR